MLLPELLRKYISDSSHVRQPLPVELSKELACAECPVAIANRQVRQLDTKDILIVKALWTNHTTENCTWEIEAMMRVTYPYLFQF